MNSITEFAIGINYYAPAIVNHIQICDMIKGNEEWFGCWEYWFWVTGWLKEETDSYVLHCFWALRNVHISATRCLLEMELRLKYRILDKWFVSEKKLSLPTCDLFPLIVSNISISQENKWAKSYKHAISIKTLTLDSMRIDSKLKRRSSKLGLDPGSVFQQAVIMV